MSKDHQTIITKKGNFYYLTTKELEDDSAQTVGKAKADQAGTKAGQTLPVVAQERIGSGECRSKLVSEGEIDDPCPDCGKQLIGGYNMSGVRCPDDECGYWFCF